MSYKFNQNKSCEFFPCHNKIKEEDFNCLFCYCPLYALKDQCGGTFKYLENGVKDCSECLFPHTRKGFDFIMKRIDKITELGRMDPKEEEPK